MNLLGTIKKVKRKEKEEKKADNAKCVEKKKEGRKRQTNKTNKQKTDDLTSAQFVIVARLNSTHTFSQSIRCYFTLKLM